MGINIILWCTGCKGLREAVREEVRKVGVVAATALQACIFCPSQVLQILTPGARMYTAPWAGARHPTQPEPKSAKFWYYYYASDSLFPLSQQKSLRQAWDSFKQDKRYDPVTSYRHVMELPQWNGRWPGPEEGGPAHSRQPAYREEARVQY